MTWLFTLHLTSLAHLADILLTYVCDFVNFKGATIVR